MSPGRARLLVWVVIAVGVAVRLPVLEVGLGMDDFAQRAMLDGSYPVPRAWWDLFAFSHGGADELRRLQDAGSMPWWSHPHLRIAPFRPLSSALVWVDVGWLGDRPWLAHVHSLAWLTAMLAAAAWTLRYALPFRVAMVALAFLALDDSHAYPTAWLANRNALVAATFSFLAVGLHLRWRREGRGRARIGSWVAVALALLAGEYGLGALAYLVAYEAWGRAGPWRARARALVGAFVVALAWVVLYRLAHAGAHGSGIYVDPLTEPWAAVVAAATRIPALTANLVLALPTGELSVSAAGREVQAWIGGAALVGLGVWSQRARGVGVDHPRWWLWGSVLAIVPALGGFPAARLAIVGSLGMSVVLAGLVWWCVDAAVAHAGARRIAWTIGVAAVVVPHGFLAPWWGQREQDGLVTLHRQARAATDTLPLRDGEGAGMRVLVLGAADPMTLLYPPLVRAHAGQPRPASWWVLSMAPGEHEIRRVSERALELRPRRPMVDSVLEQLFHRPPLSYRTGDRVALDGLDVEILEVDEAAHPTAVRFTLDRSLDDPSVLLLLPTPRAYLRYPIAARPTTFRAQRTVGDAGDGAP